MTKKQLLIRLESIYSRMNPKLKDVKFDALDEALGSVELSVSYTSFDLEATRRELKVEKRKTE